MKKLWILGLLLLLMVVPVLAEESITLSLFYGDGCPHCAAEKVFLDKLVDSGKYPNLEIEYFEIYNDAENRELFAQRANQSSVKVQGVPTTFIKDEVIVGYHTDESTGQKIVNAIEACIAEECEEAIPDDDTCIADVPIFGEVNLCTASLPALTITLGAFDGFNPCAFFVLLFLLSILIHAKSRSRMLIVGITFVIFSGLIYFMFMAAWFHFFLIAGNKWLITAIAGLVSVIIALVNIKDFFFFKKGISLTLSDKSKKKLFSRMRGVIASPSLGKMILAAVALAIFANLYELLCTVGLPMVFTRALTLRELPQISYYLYLVLYNVVYVIPLFVIVMFFTVTLGAKKLSIEQGQTLKLMSGLMMLGLGSVLLFNPELLNNFFIAIELIVGAIGLAIIVAIIKKGIGRQKK